MLLFVCLFVCLCVCFVAAATLLCSLLRAAAMTLRTVLLSIQALLQVS